MGYFSAFAALLKHSTATGLIATKLVVCPVIPPPQVNVYFAAEKTAYNHDYSGAQLAQGLTTDSGTALASHTSSAEDQKDLHGVTMRQIGHHFRMGFNIWSDKDGNACLYFEHATFTINYQATVFIAKEIMDDQCHAAVVRAHENRHIIIDVDTIQEHLPEIKAKILQNMRDIGYQGVGPMKVAQATPKRKELKKQLIAATAPIIQSLRLTVAQRQHKIDTPENLAQEQAHCSARKDPAATPLK